MQFFFFLNSSFASVVYLWITLKSISRSHFQALSAEGIQSTVTCFPMLKQFSWHVDFRRCFQTEAFLLLQPDESDFGALKTIIIYPTCANVPLSMNKSIAIKSYISLFQAHLVHLIFFFPHSHFSLPLWFSYSLVRFFDSSSYPPEQFSNTGLWLAK